MFTRRILELLYEDDEELERLEHIRHINELLDSETIPVRGGSHPGRRYIYRNHQFAHECLVRDYFAPEPVYTEQHFRRRFRMSKRLFLYIVEEMKKVDTLFTQRYDAAMKPGLSPLVRATAVMRQLAYGIGADTADEYLRVAESTALESLIKFCENLNTIFGDKYLRQPNQHDVQRLLSENAARGFPGMLGSIDCMHWQWDNCPVAWHGAYTGRSKHASTVLEAVASYDLWIWHASIGHPGSLNDLNILHRSNLFNNIASGENHQSFNASNTRSFNNIALGNAPSATYTINGHEYHMGYYLADGIYPDWATMMKSFSSPAGRKQEISLRGIRLSIPSA